ncbi:MAG: YggS family pyridoxal phosphate-dependent enzyme [Gammaproteobacteria bacterium]|nr:YggS family pyridoxal phosphate-dependent enzyme [Gammaproteobacteria bacterium]
MNNIISNLNAIKQKLGGVKLLIVTKSRDIATIKQLIAAKQFCFGENYLQEALPKFLALADEKLEWHFIGAIQPNKTRKIAEHFSWVESIDNAHVAQRLNDQRPENLPALQVCLQVNIDNDQNKGGVAVDQLLELATVIEKLPRLQLRGLMTIPKKHATLDERKQSYQLMKQVFEQLKVKGFTLDTLSMGMSDDFELAISAGATEVRIGQSIFN